jgi:hypothetical protein
VLQRPPSSKPPSKRARRRDSNRLAAVRRRERERLGLAIARAPFDRDVLNLLVEVTRTLAPEAAGDADAIGRAMFQTLKETALDEARGAHPLTP